MTAAGGPAPAFPRGDLERGIPARLERIAAAGPDRLAVTAGDEALTYGAVNAAANRLARAIRARSGPAAEPVGLLVDHDAAALVAILAALKVLDDAGRPLPPGETGELAVRSEFLSLGYWRRPDLDARVFLPDPSGGAGRVYRTGDLGRMRADGCLVHLGRKGELPKLRGHMVDPLEIERRLLEHPGLAGAAAMVREDRPGDQRLVADLVAASGGAPSPGELRAFVQERLPEHLVPSIWVVLPALPRSGTGKLDRSRLPAPGRTRPQLATALVPPRTPIERELARIWADALALDEVGVDDRFLELGGHSLIAARIVSEVGTAFGLDITGSALFEAPSVSAMAGVVAEHLVRALPPEARERLFTGLGDGEDVARPAGAAGQSAAAADAPAPAQ